MYLVESHLYQDLGQDWFRVEIGGLEILRVQTLKDNAGVLR